MLLAFAGVTGIGKSFYKDKLVEKLNFEKIKIITTRKIRTGEKNNEDKVFVTKEQLQELRDRGEIAYEFEMVGNIYAYTKESLRAKKNTVFELHYSTIFDFKKICPELCSIYLMPQNIEMAINKTKERHLEPKVEKARILEIEEHYNKINNDKKLREMFDYVVYNNYDKKSEEEIINLVRKIMSK